MKKQTQTQTCLSLTLYEQPSLSLIANTANNVTDPLSSPQQSPNSSFISPLFSSSPILLAPVNSNTNSQDPTANDNEKEQIPTIKRGRGRPKKKIASEALPTQNHELNIKTRGRPKKELQTNKNGSKPREITILLDVDGTAIVKRPVGRPSKITSEVKPKNPVGRPRKIFKTEIKGKNSLTNDSRITKPLTTLDIKQKILLTTFKELRKIKNPSPEQSKAIKDL